MPVKKEILYPIFLECCQYVEDVFWENIFENLAYGKTPSGAYISKDFLCCSYKDKDFNYKIIRKDPKELYNDIYKLFTERLGILSQKEKIRKKLIFNELEKNIKDSRSDWSSIRKKNIKDVMYEKYVIKMQNIHNLSVKQAKYLLSVILISIMFKSITAKDIKYNGDNIDKIEGIEFENGEILLQRPLCSCSSEDLDSESQLDEEEFNQNKITMSNYWLKYRTKLG